MTTSNLPTIDLYTRDGGVAATVASLPWKIPPEGLLWGERTFFLQADGRYVEGLLFFVPPDLYVNPTAKQCGWHEGETLKLEVNEKGDLVEPTERKVYGPEERVTLSGKPADGVTPGAPQPIDPATGQHKDYFVLSDAERSKGFVRPVRRSYKHEKCGTETTMGLAIAETYARDPKFYGSTFCCGCRDHFPVGKDGEFVWLSGEKVGT